MIKVTATASNGLKTEKPFNVFLTVKSNYKVEESKLIIGFSQSLEKDKKNDSGIDYLGLRRQVIVLEDFTPIDNQKKFAALCEDEVIKAITAMKLNHIESIKSE